MTINFYLDSKKSDNNTKSVICFIRGLIKSKTTYINTNIKIEPELWNSQRQEVRRNHSNSSELNTYFDKFKNQVQVLYIDYMDKYGNIELSQFKSYIEKGLFNQSKSDTAIKYFDIWDKYIQVIKSTKSYNYCLKFKNVVSMLKKFEVYSRSVLSFNSMDLKFYDSFVIYSIEEKKLSNNTISKNLKLIKTFLKWAYQRNFHKNLEFEKFKTMDEKVDIIALTEDELFKILNFDLSTNQKLSNVRDAFCLSCFTGARFSDISGLEFTDIKDGIWYLRTKKTKDPLEIPLSEYALEIINTYIASDSKFPKISNHLTNQYLKELCKLVGIDELTKITKYSGSKTIEAVKPKYELIASHFGRKTFITLSLERGMRPETLMKITGHQDFKSLKRYIQITSKVKQNEMMNVWKKN